MSRGTFQFNLTNYNKEFAYMNDNEIKFKGKFYSIENGFKQLKIENVFGLDKGKIVVFTTAKALDKLKNNSTVKTIENNKGLYVIITSHYRFINFNQVSGVSKVEQIKEKYKIKGEKELDLMENFINFLRDDLKIDNKILITKWLTGIQRELFYSDLTKKDLNFEGDKFNPMRSSSKEKRQFVYDYLNKTCDNSGILDTTVGTFSNVISIDVSSLYPYILIAFLFMIEDPYPYFKKAIPYGGKWDYFPIAFRRQIIKFYKRKEEGNKGKFYKLCINSLTGKSISLYDIGKGNTIKTSFLGPQHGFQVIHIGRLILEDITEKLKKINCIILERDTDSVKFQGDLEEVRKLIEEENKKIISRLMESGLTFDEASCGIGQWKIEYQAEIFVQRSPKHYSYCVNGKWTDKGVITPCFLLEIEEAKE